MNMRNVGIVFSPTLGIPAGVFSLMLAEFNRVFNVEAGTEEAEQEEQVIEPPPPPPPPPPCGPAARPAPALRGAGAIAPAGRALSVP